MYTHWRAGRGQGVSVRFYALMGAAGALSAAIRATISMTIVLMELVASRWRIILYIYRYIDI